MTMKELLSVVATHVVTFTIAFFAVMKLKPDIPELALVTAAVVGTWTEAFLYQRRQSTLAPMSTKAILGGVMAFVCIVEAVVAQSLTHSMGLAGLGIAISAVGTFGFPFVLYGTFEKSFQSKR